MTKEHSRVPSKLDEETLLEGVRSLTAIDSSLADVVREYGPPPLWARDPGFATLVHIILEQQVSLASARAAYAKLHALSHPITPQTFLELDDLTLRGAGFSRQKTASCRALAHALLSETLSLEALESLSDDAVREELTRIKGIGPWTANIYLLEVLLRPDIWPIGDLALATSVQSRLNLSVRPDQEALLAIGESWRPWRAVAARILWHGYLSDRGITL